MADEQEKLVGELVGFLLDPKPEVRQIALQHLKSFTASEEGRTILRKTPAVANLSRLLGDVSAVATMAHACLINLSQEQDFARQLVQKPRFCSMLVKNIVDPENKLGVLEAMLLCNLTRLEEGCQQVLQVGEELEGFYFLKLVAEFCQRKGEGQKDTFGWAGTILVNVSQLPQGRSLLMADDQRVLRDIIPFIRHEHIIRRRGVIGAVKNCCFDPSYHEILLSENGVDLLPHLLYPLVGPEPWEEGDTEGMPTSISHLGTSKRREEDTECRRMLVAALLLLSGSRRGRDIMRRRKVYPVIRNLHKSEDDPKIGEDTTMLVDHLMRDESATDLPALPAPVSLGDEAVAEKLTAVGNDDDEEEEEDEGKGKGKEKITSQ